MIHITQYPLMTKYNATRIIIHNPQNYCFAPPRVNPGNQYATRHLHETRFSAKTTDHFTETFARSELYICFSNSNSKIMAEFNKISKKSIQNSHLPQTQPSLGSTKLI